MKKMFLIVFLILTVNISADSSILNITTQTDINLNNSTRKFIKIEVDINNSGYIYGNPKGPGTGKDTEISVLINSTAIKNVFLSKPQKYYPEGSPEWVNIYKDKLHIFIPLSDIKFQKSNSMEIGISALFCTDESCTPVKASKTFNLNLSDTDSSEIINKPEENSIALNTALVTAVKFTDSQLQIEFSPVEAKNNNITGIITAILFGLLAGLILNFMPCVLPVISIKILAFIKNADKNSRILKTTGIFFSAGIILSFLILASVITFFGLNWGAVFQSKNFIRMIIIIMFIMALSFFGLFTFKIPGFAAKGSTVKTKSIYAEAFIHGFLATLLATPCSGPFLGATLTWTLTQPVIIIYTVFISIGIGMSLPYLILSFNPGLMKYIPKSGNWMITFEKIIGLFVIAAVIYFLTLLDYSSLKASLWTLLIIFIAFIQYGKYGTSENKKMKRCISAILLVLLMIAGYFIPQKIASTSSSSEYNQAEYTPEIFTKLDSTDIFIIKFTADWCINCKILESAVYDTAKFAEFASDENITVFTADLSNNNPDAEFLMNKLGSRSIPFAAVFSRKDLTSPVILRDIYSLNDLRKSVNILKNSSENFKLENLDL